MNGNGKDQSFKIDKALVDKLQAQASALQSKLLMMFDQDVGDLKGPEKLFVVGRWALITGRLWQHYTKQALAIQEMLFVKGIEIKAEGDIGIDKLTELMSVPMKPASPVSPEAQTPTIEEDYEEEEDD